MGEPARKNRFGIATKDLKHDVSLEHFFALSQDMLCIAGLDGYFKTLNPAWSRTLGWSQRELKAKPFLDFVHPDDQERVLRHVEKLGQPNYKTVNFESRYLCKDGQYRHVAWSGSVAYSHIYFVARDISALKVATRELVDRTEQLHKSRETILDSIRYARRIQQALLPTHQDLAGTVREHFVLWEPRDMVSGDFYWVRKVYDDCFLIAIADVTGHGVPSALLGQSAIALLNQSVGSGRSDPSQVLRLFHQLFHRTFSRENNPFQIEEGLEIGLCFVNKKTRMVKFSGAARPLCIAHGQSIEQFAGDSRSIQANGRAAVPFEFSSHTIEVPPDAVLYLSTDGLRDQKGGDKGLPFGSRRFNRLMVENYEKPLSQQLQIFRQTFRQWQGEYPQVDDITMIGFRV